MESGFATVFGLWVAYHADDENFGFDLLTVGIHNDLLNDCGNIISLSNNCGSRN